MESKLRQLYNLRLNCFYLKGSHIVNNIQLGSNLKLSSREQLISRAENLNNMMSIPCRRMKMV